MSHAPAYATASAVQILDQAFPECSRKAWPGVLSEGTHGDTDTKEGRNRELGRREKKGFTRKADRVSG